jgi:hypothetical protein
MTLLPESLEPQHHAPMPPAPALPPRNAVPPPDPALEGGSAAQGEAAHAAEALDALVASQLDLAALHQSFIEQQTDLHVRVLRLLAPSEGR